MKGVVGGSTGRHVGALRADVYTPTMSARATPCTLEMSMAGIREMSTILTPPEKPLTETAYDRLATISQNSDLGAGMAVATAHEILRRRPGSGLLLREKADLLGFHQTSRNSCVIHSGIYYPPGSLKVELIRGGAELTKEFAAVQGIPLDTRGKLFVAADAVEHARTHALYERSKTNGLDVEVLDETKLRRRELAVTGSGPLLVPTTGIVDHRRGTEVLSGRPVVRSLGVEESSIAEVSDRVTAAGPARLVVRWPPGHLRGTAGGPDRPAGRDADGLPDRVLPR